ncbi:hypothetical protein Aduo_019678 [Ancylostoma duodenale]
MFAPPPWLPTPPIPPFFVPQTFFPPAARTPNVQQTAAALCEIPSSSHGPPIVEQSPPPKAPPKKLAAPPSPSSNPVSGPNPDFSTSSPVAKEQSPPRFKGEAEVRKKGRREILFYHIPGSTKVYRFKVNSEKDNIKNCFCIGCLRNCGCAGLKAIGTDFLSDPCGLRHVCRPMKRVERKVKKVQKKKIQKKRVQINKEIPVARRYPPTYRPPVVSRDKSKKGGVTEKKHRYNPIPFREKKPTITMQTIMMFKRMESLDGREESIGNERRPKKKLQNCWIRAMDTLPKPVPRRFRGRPGEATIDTHGSALNAIWECRR